MAYKIAILGGGPGGYVAAIRAAQMGAKVAVIEKDELGGTCLNRGCIPTKALVAGTELLHGIKKAREFGISAADPVVDLGLMVQRKNQVVQRLVTGINFLFKKNKIDLYQGTGSFVSNNHIEVLKTDGSVEKITAENMIIATGSEPALIPGLGYDGDRVITSNEALNLTEIPRRLLVIGGGVIGCEFACIFSELGSEVTVVDIMPSLLPGVDKEVSRLIQSLFKRRKITVKTGEKITGVRKDAEGVAAQLESGAELAADRILVSIGRTLNTGDIGLEKLGVELGPRGEIVVNSRMQTNIPNVYAIGDVTNKILLAHVASTQGLTAAENIMGGSQEMDYNTVPNCIFTRPEVAGVGITGDQAGEKGISVNVGKFPFMALGKAQAAAETEGFVKIIADSTTDKILGVHIVGPHATDLIAEAALAVKQGVSAAQLAETIHAHPTLAEAILEAAEAVHGKSIHI
ncbi:MAG: dihydrolipoyl dehydrogenase [Firmicutes bacterium HGW-Firmicutes-14]|nr:MAG: dihydrolipoyl dehydrogenase [Firmicutes bacterium HGW-Firmicutes-14]